MTSLSTKLAALETAGKPIQVGIIGAGKFGSMFISQSFRTTGLRLAGIADLSKDRALASLKRTGFPEDKYDATCALSVSEGIKAGKTAITTDSAALIATPEIDVILEVTGNPAAGIRHALLCCEHKKHIVMINVEADVLAGPLLARKAREAGIIYSMAYGDQPALIAEMVDWAHTAGFEVVCAGKGTKHLPEYHYSTPDTVWNYYGFTDEQLAGGDFNPQMFNSFLDGTKSALEMAAVANGCGLSPPTNGLKFPPCGVWDLPEVLKPESEGGQCEKNGTVEVVSCMETDGRWVFNHLRWGVYVVIKGELSASDPVELFTDLQTQLLESIRKSVSSSTVSRQTRADGTLLSTSLTTSLVSSWVSLSPPSCAEESPQGRQRRGPATSLRPPSGISRLARSSTARVASPSTVGSCLPRIQWPSRDFPSALHTALY